jgi:hypothetical protein
MKSWYVFCQPAQGDIQPHIPSAKLAIQPAGIVGVPVQIQFFQFLSVEDVFHIFCSVFQPYLPGALA